MDDVFSVIRKRRSTRLFEPTPIPTAVLEEIADAGRYAPTARHVEPWEFVIVTRRETLVRIAGLAENARFLAQAGACIAVFCRETKYYLEDGCAATENMLLAATAHTIGSCWIAGDKKEYCEEIASLLYVPEGVKLVSLIALGYPQGGSSMAPAGRKALKELLHWEEY
jgi:nitroreductase